MKAIVIGASGLTGKLLVEKLVKDNDFTSIECLLRKPLGISHPKIIETIVQFEDIIHHAPSMNGDVLFCCLGTTIKKAGSQLQFEKIDFDLPYSCARIAVKNGVKKFVLISAIGADSSSGNFYLQTKGKLENSISELPFDAVHIFQPALLMGLREESRPAEKISIWLMPIIDLLLWGRFTKYRGMDVHHLAQAMINASKLKSSGTVRYTFNEITALSKE